MKPIFADTSYYIAVLSEEDHYHHAAVAWGNNFFGRMVVTEYVLVELGNGLCRSKYRSRYGPLVEHLLRDPETVFVPASKRLFLEGLKLFTGRPDKSWSMVDCLSFVVMKQRRMMDALTTDQHFNQAGFRALLRETKPA
ncbi:MAG TPA: PIN domain-containing protein [Gemmataceae bacterium]|nr:PIN domain-containing protein [Gemmataceae bacterium]